MKRLTKISSAIMIFFSLLYLPLFAEGLRINKRNPLIVHNFNGPEPEKNVYGYDSEAKNLNTKYEAVCNAKYIKDRTLHKKGKYLKLEYDVTANNSEVGYVIPFHGFDLTYFKKISFYIKGDLKKGHTRQIKVDISTWNTRETAIVKNITPEWKKVVINLDSFVRDDDNFNDEGVENISFIIDNLTSEVTRGAIYLDDITLIPADGTDITLKELKMSKYIKPRKRLFKFPKDETKSINLNVSDKKLLRQIAKDTWNFFKYTIDRNTYLVMDNITVSKNIKTSKVGDYTNITNIGLQILSLIAAYDLGFIDKPYARKYIRKILATLERMKKWNGLFYNYYLTRNNMIANHFISSVDNGWMAAGLICLRNAFNNEFYEEATSLLMDMDFSKLYNEQLGQLSLGYDVKTSSPSKYNYGLIYTEPRITSLIAIAKGDIPSEHWFRVYRTLPKSWTWQSQKPKGRTKEIMGIKFFGGYYTYADTKFVPSWGGSMFEALMPLTVLNELKYAKKSFGENDKRMVRLTIKYAENNNLKYWGFSPCSVPDSAGGYKEYGVPVLGAKGYPAEEYVTPHAALLALMPKTEIKNVMKNIRKLLKDFPDIYGQFGFYDTVDTDSEEINKKYLALDQSMILLSICNYINDGSIQKKFEKDEFFNKIRDLIGEENFFD